MAIDDKPIKKITFKRDMTSKDYDYLRNELKLNVIEEGKKHMIVRFESQMDYLAFKCTANIQKSK